MSDENFPGFVDESLNKPQKPEPKKQQQGAAFNPFADVNVSTNPVDAPAAAKAPAGKPGAQAVPAAEEEADVQPGAAKDLWSCPHCGARNKPGRAECRSCGKSPHDEVIVPWHQQTPIRIGIAAGVIVLIAIIYFASGGAPAFVSPGPEHLDAKVRVGGSSKESTSVGEITFTACRIAAVSGRVLASQPYHKMPGVIVAVIALGKHAADDAIMGNVNVDFGEDMPTLSPDMPHAVLYLLCDRFTAPPMPRNAYVSVIGDEGTLDQGGFKVAGSARSHVIRVKQMMVNP